MRIITSFIIVSFLLFLICFSCNKKDTVKDVIADPGALIPKILAISPLSGHAKTIITISGKYFGLDSSSLVVKINGVEAKKQFYSDSVIKVVAPQAAGTGPVTVSSSAGTGTGPIFTFDPDIYVAGYERVGFGNAIAKYWKNGVEVPIIGPENYGYANSIAVSDTNVFLSGFVYNGTGMGEARFWKNGEAFQISAGKNNANGYAIAVKDTIAYIVGSETDEPYKMNDVAKYWVNTKPTALSGLSSKAYGISLVNNDIYISGYQVLGVLNYFPDPVYWKNGIVVTLPKVNPLYYSYATCIAATNDHVYVAGYELGNKYVARYWKDGLPVSLSDGSNDAVASSIFVYNNDIYISGYESKGGRKIAKYWKNGVSVALTNGTTDAEANAIFILGGNVYVAGYESTLPSFTLAYPDEGHVAKYWLNGVPITLGHGILPSEGKGIFIK